MSNCELMATGEPFDEKGYGIGVPLGAAYRDELTMVILSLGERGEIKRLEDKSVYCFALSGSTTERFIPTRFWWDTPAKMPSPTPPKKEISLPDSPDPLPGIPPP